VSDRLQTVARMSQTSPRRLVTGLRAFRCVWRP